MFQFENLCNHENDLPQKMSINAHLCSKKYLVITLSGEEFGGLIKGKPPRVYVFLLRIISIRHCGKYFERHQGRLALQEMCRIILHLPHSLDCLIEE